MSFREYQLWLEYLDEDWNHPSRTDHYLMAIVGALYHTKSNRRLSWKELRIPFRKPSGDLSDEMDWKTARSILMGASGYKDKPK